MNATIRQARRADLDALATIIDEIPFYQDYGVRGASVRDSLSDVITHATQHTLHVAACERDLPMGFAWYLPRGAFGRSHYLRLLAISPKHQRAGLGQQLIEYGEHHFLNPHGICLLVTEDNTPARAFYERLGYVHTGTLPNYVRPGRNECLYYKAPR